MRGLTSQPDQRIGHLLQLAGPRQRVSLFGADRLWQKRRSGQCFLNMSLVYAPEIDGGDGGFAGLFERAGFVLDCCRIAARDLADDERRAIVIEDEDRSTRGPR